MDFLQELSKTESGQVATKEDVDAFFAQVDDDGSGKIEFGEFSTFLMIRQKTKDARAE